MKKNRYLLFIAILSSLILTGCNIKPIFTFVVNNRECEPPCWQGITPGKTGVDEARELLMTNSVIDPQSMEWYEDTYFGYDLLTWKFKSTNDYEGTIYANDNTIYAISFDPLLVRPVVNLSQAITAYGEPEIIFSREVATNPDFGDLFFLYPEKGIWFASLQALELYDFRDELRPETPIRYIVYVFPDEFENVFETMVIYDYQNFGISPEAIQNSFHEWKGYGVISELYPAGTD